MNFNMKKKALKGTSEDKSMLDAAAIPNGAIKAKAHSPAVHPIRTALIVLLCLVGEGRAVLVVDSSVGANTNAQTRLINGATLAGAAVSFTTGSASDWDLNSIGLYLNAGSNASPQTYSGGTINFNIYQVNGAATTPSNLEWKSSGSATLSAFSANTTPTFSLTGLSTLTAGTTYLLGIDATGTVTNSSFLKLNGNVGSAQPTASSGWQVPTNYSYINSTVFGTNAPSLTSYSTTSSATGFGFDLNATASITGTTSSITGNITDTNVRFNQSTDGTYSGLLSGLSSLKKFGTGAVTLSGANTYTGSTSVSSGTLQVDTDNALGTTSDGTSVSAGAALKLNGVNYSSAEAVSLNGSGISNGGALVNSGTSTFAGQITTATNASINAGGGTLNLTGGLVKNGTTATLMGGGRVNITGTGISGASANSDLVVDGTTVVVSAASNYNGPTSVQNNASFVANAAVITTQVNVSANSTLSGTSSITTAGGAEYVYLNGTLVVGDSTLSSPLASTLDLKSSGVSGSTILGTSINSFLSFDLFQRGGDLTALAAAADSIRLFGTLDATLGGTLVLIDSIAGAHTFAAGDKWQLFDLSNGGSFIGGFAHVDYSSLGSLALGLTGSFNSSTGEFSIVAAAVPEPSRALLLAVGLAGALLRRRRTSKEL
jgi:autotransporter-associated beta strand protein